MSGLVIVGMSLVLVFLGGGCWSWFVAVVCVFVRFLGSAVGCLVVFNSVLVLVTGCCLVLDVCILLFSVVSVCIVPFVGDVMRLMFSFMFFSRFSW